MPAELNSYDRDQLAIVEGLIASLPSTEPFNDLMTYADPDGNFTVTAILHRYTDLDPDPLFLEAILVSDAPYPDPIPVEFFSTVAESLFSELTNNDACHIQTNLWYGGHIPNQYPEDSIVIQVRIIDYMS